MSDILRIFKSRLPRIAYMFRDGSTALFIPRTNSNEGQYLTKDPVKIKELDQVVKGWNMDETKSAGPHPHLYVDPKESEVEEHLADPAVAMREKLADQERDKLIALLGDPNQMRSTGITPESLEKLKELMSNRDMGVTDSKPALQGIGNSTTTAPTAPESNSAVSGGIKVNIIKSAG